MSPYYRRHGPERRRLRIDLLGSTRAAYVTGVKARQHRFALRVQRQETPSLPATSAATPRALRRSPRGPGLPARPPDFAPPPPTNPTPEEGSMATPSPVRLRCIRRWATAADPSPGGPHRRRQRGHRGARRESPAPRPGTYRAPTDAETGQPDGFAGLRTAAATPAPTARNVPRGPRPRQRPARPTLGTGSGGRRLDPHSDCPPRASETTPRAGSRTNS